MTGDLSAPINDFATGQMGDLELDLCHAKLMQCLSHDGLTTVREWCNGVELDIVGHTTMVQIIPRIATGGMAL